MRFGCKPIFLYPPRLTVVQGASQGQKGNHHPQRKDGSLRDISPRLLGILDLGLPKEMTGGDMRVPIAN
ncbi:MAG: hypothetical protein ACLQG3_16635 [Terracidiphilus sp.]